MVRLTMLAQAIDMIADGTSAPMAIAANATPANHPGKMVRIRAGTAKLLP